MRLTRFRFGEFELDPASRELWRGGVLLPVPLKSLECLAYLVAHRERAVGRDELVSAVWGRADVSDAVITQTMRRARKALDDAGNRQAIVRTVPGFGYRWIAPVDVVDGARQASAPPPPEPEKGPIVADAAVDTAPDATLNRIEPPPPSRRAHPRRWILAALLLPVIVAGAWWIGARRDSPPPQAQVSDGLVMVMPVAVEPDDREYSWVRLGAMEYAADRLRGATLKVTPTEQTLHLSAANRAGDAQVDATTVPSDKALRQLLASSGAQWLLLPSAQQEHGRWRVRLRALARGSDVRVEAQGDSPLRAMAVATDAWLRRIGRPTSDSRAPTPLQERLQRIDAELDAGQLEAAREQIAAAPNSDRTSPQMLVREGQLEYRAGRIGQAQRIFEHALAFEPQALDDGTRAKGLMGMGAVSLRQQRLADAETYYSEAVALLHDSNPGLLGNAYNGRGVTRVQRGDVDGAVGDLGLARVTMQQNGDAVSAAMVGSNLGRIEAMRDHWPQAVQEYDKAIAIFDRYQVRDYQAATLAAKASAQLAMVQPGAAAATIERARTLAPGIEDDALLNVVNLTFAQVALRNGRLDVVATVLKALSTQADQDQDGSGAGLAMALAISRGDRLDAANLAGHIPRFSRRVGADAVFAGIQAAANEQTARAWRATLPSASVAQEADRTYASLFANALLERRFGTPDQALTAASDAVRRANREGSPDDRVRASMVRALVLLDTDQVQPANAVLGELDAYVDVDYRVAWLAWRLSQRGGDQLLAERTRRRLDQLRGQRDIAIEPVL
ncbi:winged helix-turn-helix domain-containing protein [Lysobacter soli]|uniref:winged helix-turn-helix domain-containing protein n=1 Tax=Lysobacter soli TaxID=453783 RepID=UPI0037C73AC2